MYSNNAVNNSSTGNYPNDLYNPGKIGGNQQYIPQRRDEVVNQEIEKDKHSIGFWFWLKEQVQFIYSSDVGLVESENRVLHIDQDLFRLKIISGILSRSFKNIFSISIILLISFILLSFKNPNIQLVTFTLVSIFLGLILFVPMWQVLTTKEFIVNSQLKKIYRIIYSNFKVYLVITIGVLFVGVALLGIIGYNPNLLLNFNPSFEMGSMVIHPFAKIINFFIEYKFDFRTGFQLLAMAIATGFSLFLLIYYMLLSNAESNRIKNIKKIREKTMSEIEKCASVLDDF